MINRYLTAGMMWVLAALLSVAVTVVFRDDPVWYALTLALGAAGAAVGVSLLRWPVTRTVVVSSILGVVWVLLYLILVFIQLDDIQAWTSDAFFAVLGGAAASVAFRAGQQAGT